MNSHGLFFTEEEAVSFKNAYDGAFARGEIGDGDMEAHIFCLYEVNPEDALRCLAGEGGNQNEEKQTEKVQHL